LVGYLLVVGVVMVSKPRGVEGLELGGWTVAEASCGRVWVTTEVFDDGDLGVEAGGDDAALDEFGLPRGEEALGRPPHALCPSSPTAPAPRNGAMRSSPPRC
jgi:hypothetical protein